ncbi:MAG TPA: C39 family peptidase [Candidatus Limnocylindrales bacterium]|nr:C39 family peptidase [Candidatus Limnocylindrales bacterium]
MLRAAPSIRRFDRIVVTAIMLVAGAGSTLSLGGSPVSSQTAVSRPASGAVLPATGMPPAARGLMRQEAQTPAATLYVEYVPPPPPPPPPAAAPWTPPAGYVTIAVPIYRQAMVLDCETSALRMGLATFGHYFSDGALFAFENPDLRAPVMGPNHTVAQWGDPYTNFVGNVNGSDWIPTGYGVYYPVIVNIARSHGLPNTEGGEGYAPSTVYAALLSGHPVEVWVETNWMRPRVGVFRAWDGRMIRYSFVEHAVILSGVSNNMVRVNDPLHGSQYWISKVTFETVWRDFNDMAVIYR